MPGLHPHRACPEKTGREERPGREAGLAPHRRAAAEDPGPRNHVSGHTAATR